MLEKFVLNYAKLLVSNPDVVNVTIEPIQEHVDEIIIFAKQEDIGILIGKGGKMSNAIRTVAAGCKPKSKKSYKVSVRATS